MDNIRKLKYQYLIDQQNLTFDCPEKSCTSSYCSGFRWMFAPVENPDNFLPNILFNQKHNIPPRKNSPDDYALCKSCALSMFNSEKSAIEKFNNIPKLNKEMLGYTHLGRGDLDGLGLMTRTSQSGHFSFFEYEDTDLRSIFIIVTELN